MKPSTVSWLLTAAFTVLASFAQAQEISRTELDRGALSGSSTMEVVVARLEIPPGATVPRHSHHGDEYLIVLQGGEFTAPDGTVVPFEAGMATHFPAGEVHGGLTVSGDTPIILYTTHIVEKGKPLNIPAE